MKTYLNTTVPDLKRVSVLARDDDSGGGDGDPIRDDDDIPPMP